MRPLGIIEYMAASFGLRPWLAEIYLVMPLAWVIIYSIQANRKFTMEECVINYFIYRKYDVFFMCTIMHNLKQTLLQFRSILKLLCKPSIYGFYFQNVKNIRLRLVFLLRFWKSYNIPCLWIASWRNTIWRFHNWW